eukprot:TRINITY_DN36697_c0_g1_i1.p1 TRINITY_DN36697_c0_g1~~TRINITY_DN36697_c0_g1_i1.p1  ORF type:complete len:1098 (+),score=160.55 TRINITY_DN36697_c0_g1_i1:45-3338(+)
MDWARCLGERSNNDTWSKNDRWAKSPVPPEGRLTPRSAVAAAGSAVCGAGPSALQKRQRPHVWQESPAYPEPRSSPAWANGREGPAPVSMVEAVFRDKYNAVAMPSPIDMNEMDSMRVLLASEPSPRWEAPVMKPRGDPCGCGGGRLARQARPRRMVPLPCSARGNMPSRPATRDVQRRSECPPPTVSASEGPPPLSARSASAEGGVRRTKPYEPSKTAAPPWVGVVDDDHNDGGVHLDIAPGLSERLRRLTTVRRESEVYVWVIVECCRDCANHDNSLRHDESHYSDRFHKLKEAVESRFPQGVQVELLAPAGESAPLEAPASQPVGNNAPARRGVREPTYRIGSFEVYMCSASPLTPYGAAPLMGRRGSAGQSFNGVCLASKLKNRTWPSIDVVVKRVAVSMPHVPVSVGVHTELDLPLSKVELSVWGPDKTPMAKGETSDEGVGTIGLPMFMPVTLKAQRRNLMEMQTKELEVVAPGTEVSFTAETVVQLWQMETAKELVVYCSSPRVARSKAPNLAEGLVPFQGQLECESGETHRADAEGFISSRPDPLADADLLSLTGWRSCPVAETARQVHGTGRFVEIGRLGVPIAEVSLVTRCCASCVPGARIFVDGEAFGVTDDSGLPLSCGLRTGEHSLQAEHALLSPQGLCVPLNISGSTTCGVQVDMPLDRLRFVCAAAPGVRSQGASADLWLVGGDLAQWRCSRGAPPMDAEVWLWDGELRSSGHGASGSPRPLRVQAGILSRHALSSASRNDDEDENGEESADEVTRRPSGGGYCLLSDALASPISAHGPWRVVLHPAPPPACQECAVTRLARLAAEAAPAMWLGRLAAEGNGRQKNTVSEHRVAVHTSCCGRGVPSVGISIDDEAAGETNEDGEFVISDASGQCHIGFEGIPPCLLPGGSNRLVAHLDATHHGRIDLEVACLIWVYWVPPEEPEEPDPDWEEDEPPAEEDGTVWVCTNGDQVPDEARPIQGILRCPDAEDAEISIDGQSKGPILLRPRPGSGVSGGSCLLAQVTFEVTGAPDGFTYQARTPSPLAERQAELGGCELQRLMHCPVVVGYLKASNPALRATDVSSSHHGYEDGSFEDGGLDEYD